MTHDSDPVLALLWRSYLPYHAARLACAAAYPALRDTKVVGVQVTEDAAGYEFLADKSRAADLVTCMPGERLTDVDGGKVYAATLAVLRRLAPRWVFAPATPFPEGMAGIRYAREFGASVFIMDDSWERTDAKGGVVSAVKRAVHACVDGAFVPDSWYRDYFAKLGIPAERLVYPVDVVDNQDFARPAIERPVHPRYLFVGRDLPRKGLATLLGAYAAYRERSPAPWKLRIVGPVPEGHVTAEGVEWAGPRVGRELREEYWSAAVLVVPSDYDQWGLVVNEGMAASLPVIASRDVGAARSLVRDGSTGWTFPARDVSALMASLLLAESVPSHVRLRMGDAARELVQREFSLERFAQALNRARQLPRRPDPGWISLAAARMWKGRLQAY